MSSYVLDKKFFIDPSITMECICTDIIEIIKRKKCRNMVAVDKDLPQFPFKLKSNGALCEQNNILASSWLSEISSVISEGQIYVRETTPPEKEMPYAETLFQPSSISLGQPSRSTYETSRMRSISPVLEHVSPAQFFMSAFDGHMTESFVEHQKQFSSDHLFAILQRYVSFVMPSLRPLHIQSSLQNEDVLSPRIPMDPSSPHVQGQSCPLSSMHKEHHLPILTKLLSLGDFCFSITDSDSKMDILMIKSLFSFVICFHMLMFRPISSELKSFLVPLMESIASSDDTKTTTNFQYTFPFQFSVSYSLELEREGFPLAPGDMFDPEFKLFINPFVGLLLKCKTGSSTSSSSTILKIPTNIQGTPNRSTLPSDASVHSIFLEHSDASSIFEDESNYSSALEQIAIGNPLVKYPEYDHTCKGPEFFRTSCRWLDKEFLGEGPTKTKAKEHAAKLAVEYYQKHHHNLFPTNTVNLLDEGTFPSVNSMPKNPDNLTEIKEIQPNNDDVEPSFSPLRESPSFLVGVQKMFSSSSSMYLSAAQSLLPSMVDIRCADDLLKYGQYFMDLYTKLAASTTTTKTPEKGPIATEGEDPLRPNALMKTMSDGLLKTLPSMLPPLNGNRKYVSIVIEYCQTCRVTLPEFRLSTHTAPFSGRCQWLGQSFLTGYTSELDVRIFHHKKSDAKEELAKMAISHLLFSNLITENLLRHLRVPELVPFLDKGYLMKKYHQQMLPTPRHFDQRNQGNFSKGGGLNGSREQRVNRLSSSSHAAVHGRTEHEFRHHDRCATKPSNGSFLSRSPPLSSSNRFETTHHSRNYKRSRK